MSDQGGVPGGQTRGVVREIDGRLRRIEQRLSTQRSWWQSASGCSRHGRH